jgi:hypothetical protein
LSIGIHTTTLIGIGAGGKGDHVHPLSKVRAWKKGEAKLCFCFPLNLAKELETVEIKAVSMEAENVP